MSLTPLYRPQALAHAQRAGLVQPGGLIRLSSPWAPWVSAAAGLILLGLCVLLARGHYSRRIALDGELVPAGGYLEVKAPALGWVANWRVVEGQSVSAGAVLATVRTERAVAQGDVAELQERALERRHQALEDSGAVLSRQRTHRLDQLQARGRALQSELRALLEEGAVLQAREALLEQAAVRDQALFEQGFVSAAHLQERQAQRLELQSRRSQWVRQRSAVGHEQEALAAEMEQARTQHQRQELDLRAEAARLEQERAEWRARHALVLRAPQDGRVVMRARLEGQSVQAGQTLVGLMPRPVPDADPSDTSQAQQPAGASVVPGDPGLLQVVLWAPSRAVGLIRPGMPVWIRCAAFAPARHGLLRGVVREVGEVPMAAAPWPGSGESPLGLGGLAASMAYRVQVDLPEGSRSTLGLDLALKGGMSVQADVLREPRALWEWWMEPLLSRWQQWAQDPRHRSPSHPQDAAGAGRDARSDAI